MIDKPLTARYALHRNPETAQWAWSPISHPDRLSKWYDTLDEAIQSGERSAWLYAEAS